MLSEEFCAVVKRIADVCLNGSDTRPAVDEAYPQLCQELEVILENNRQRTEKKYIQIYTSLGS